MSRIINTRIFFLMLYAFAVTGCLGAKDPDRNKPVLSFAAGDSFNATGHLWSHVVNSQTVQLTFDLYIVPEKYILNRNQADNDRNYDIMWPSDEIWNRYGDNAYVVKSVYTDCVYLLEQWAHKDFGTETFYSTVFRTGDFTIIADKDFGGISAGEDLSSIFESDFVFPDVSDLIENLRLESLNDLINTVPSNCVSCCRLSTIGPSELNEPVTFTFRLPVRKVKLLKWICDLSENPSAVPDYLDDLVTWSFTVGKYKITGLAVHLL